ncbi:MAG: RnfABCDGE type electron transport complex subunit B [Bacteroides sp.]|nr:RnfABCDGE type electron transport complex subunit B [Barnesiella sp.]MBD5253442.1 RnfABCDGE type electron transport complex subunit B [Barnesiella sp.]MBD5344502.1 RnfABCDGE type electron transport complex subunit B [Bacteroides sp.]MBD5368894.1 RnfABCDGE type electron transport complex subunit B [Bacteroides sp.]
MNLFLISILVLGGIGVIAAILLYFISRRFNVVEDPRIGQVEELLPGANCGGCGRSGCHDFAVACVGADSLEGLVCPASGSSVMARIGEIVGLVASEAKPKVAVLKCNGTCDVRPRVARYDGAQSCAVLAMAGTGEGSCPFGCLGCGDCVVACNYDAVRINPETGLAEFDDEKCVGCGACVKACPRHIIELRDKGPRGMRVWVACSNTEKGGVAAKECKAACIGCSKCVKVCTHEAITVNNNLSYIDFTKCKLCRKCVDVCPTHAILTANFPVKKPAPAAETAAANVNA